MTTLNPRRLRRIEDWFAAFVRPFSRGDEAARQNWALKRSHTLRVRKLAAGLALNLEIGAAETRTVEAIALLHDVGRFPQFRRHRTLYDRRSEDHAALGRRIVREEGVLQGLAPALQKTVLRAIFLHNKASLPRGEDRRVLLYTRIIRDADKLDNLNLISRYYSRPRRKRIHAFELGLKEGPRIADQFFEDVRAGKIVSLKRLRTIGELKLLVAGWIHDINFPSSFRRIRKGRYLDLLRRSYPPSKRIDAVFASLDARLAAGCRTTNSANCPPP
jgi:putative nucleotidyltransferase with HDIG domain